MDKARIDELICDWSMQTGTAMTEKAQELLVDTLALELAPTLPPCNVRELTGKHLTPRLLLELVHPSTVKNQHAVILMMDSDEEVTIWATFLKKSGWALVLAHLSNHVSAELEGRVEHEKEDEQ